MPDILLQEMPRSNSYWNYDNFFKFSPIMDTPRRFNDCYYYYYSTCNKGEACPFRHEPASLKCEIICQDWLHGKCHNLKCTLRHMELRKDRSNIPCYWEDQPSGCTKPHCSFQHSLDRQRAEFMVRHLGLDPNPVPSSTSAGQQTRRPRKNCDYNKRNETVTSTEPPYQIDAAAPISDDQESYISGESVDTRTVPTNIPEQVHNNMPYNTGMESIIVSIEEDSDNEILPSKPAATKVEDIHIKTLEEIRLERIQKESAAYYNYTDSKEVGSSQNNFLTKRIIPERCVTRPPIVTVQEDFKGFVLGESRKRKKPESSVQCEVLNKRRYVLPLKPEDMNVTSPRRIVLAPDCCLYENMQSVVIPSETLDVDIDDTAERSYLGNNLKQEVNRGRIYINPNYRRADCIDSTTKSFNITPPNLDFTIKTLQQIREDRVKKFENSLENATNSHDYHMSEPTQKCFKISTRRKIVGSTIIIDLDTVDILHNDIDGILK